VCHSHLPPGSRNGTLHALHEVLFGCITCNGESSSRFGIDDVTCGGSRGQTETRGLAPPSNYTATKHAWLSRQRSEPLDQALGRNPERAGQHSKVFNRLRAERSGKIRERIVSHCRKLWHRGSERSISVSTELHERRSAQNARLADRRSLVNHGRQEGVTCPIRSFD